jgi:hypothetical protein
MTPTPSLPPDALIDIVHWSDPVVEANGFHISDTYNELFWLPILGPTATWLLRRLAGGLEQEPQGYTTDMSELARSIGVTYTPGKHNPFARGLHRCIMFGAAQQISVLPRTTIGVRTVLPVLPHRHQARLPHQLRIAHDDWVRRTPVVANTYT